MSAPSSTARVGVITFPGTLDDVDASRAITLAGGEAVSLWHADADLRGVDAIVVPGGFSYGDYLRAGAIARFAPVMESVVKAAEGGMPVRQTQRTAIQTRLVVESLETRHHVTAEEPLEPGLVQRLSIGEADRHCAAARNGLLARGLLTQRRRVDGEDSAHGVVELTNAGEPGREGDVAHGHRGRLNQRSRGVRAMCACEGEWSRADLRGQHPGELSAGVSERVREGSDAAAFDGSVGDQPHRAGGEIGVDIPMRRAGGGIGLASSASAVAVLLGCRCGRYERDVLRLGGHCRTRRAAVDSRRAHGCEELAVEPCVARGHGPVAPLEIQLHELYCVIPACPYPAEIGHCRQAPSAWSTARALSTWSSTIAALPITPE